MKFDDSKLPNDREFRSMGEHYVKALKNEIYDLQEIIDKMKVQKQSLIDISTQNYSKIIDKLERNIVDLEDIMKKNNLQFVKLSNANTLPNEIREILGKKAKIYNTDPTETPRRSEREIEEIERHEERLNRELEDIENREKELEDRAREIENRDESINTRIRDGNEGIREGEMDPNSTPDNTTRPLPSLDDYNRENSTPIDTNRPNNAEDSTDTEPNRENTVPNRPNSTDGNASISPINSNNPAQNSPRQVYVSKYRNGTGFNKIFNLNLFGRNSKMSNFKDNILASDRLKFHNMRVFDYNQPNSTNNTQIIDIGSSKFDPKNTTDTSRQCLEDFNDDFCSCFDDFRPCPDHNRPPCDYFRPDIDCGRPNFDDCKPDFDHCRKDCDDFRPPCNDHDRICNNQIDIVRLLLLYLALRPNSKYICRVSNIAMDQFDIMTNIMLK